MKQLLIIAGILAAVAFSIYITLSNRDTSLDAMKPDTNGVPIDMDMVKLVSPKPNSVITSPLTVTGEARGFWYFEASFPVKILDANGNELGVIPAQAQGEWMTTDLVPFRAVVNFKPSPTATGFLVLEKDNPSGLPEHDQKITYPIRFR